MCNVLAIFLVISFILESIDIVFHGYLAEESWGILSVLLFDKIGFNMFGLQWGLGMILPFILLLSKKVGTKRAFIASLLVLIGVFAMRVNVVIGGQSMSKSLAGFMQYDFPILPTNLETFKEGLSAVVILSAMPFILFYIFNKILPVFSKGKTITAEDLMTHTPITVSADASASEAASFALVKHLACLPVVDSEGKVVGQVTQTQLINMNKEKDKVKDIMVKAVTVHEDVSAEKLIKIISENNVDGLVVVSEDNKPLGVISKLDIVRFVEAGETCCV
jgi:CBS domain-containing protein